MLRSSLSLFILCLAAAFATAAQARVFSFQDANLAPYLRTTGALSHLGKAAFSSSSGTDTVLSGESAYAYSGELGFLFGLGDSVKVRLGAEMIEHKPVDAKGLNPSGAERFKLASSVTVFNPNVSLEFIYKTSANVRFYFLLGGGYADVTVDNIYTMSNNDLGVGNFSEKLSGTTYSGHAGIGAETLFVDNVTFSIDLGYRYLPVRSLSYKAAVNNIVSPSGVAQGAEALNHDGNPRTFDLSGISAAVALRFYLHFL